MAPLPAHHSPAPRVSFDQIAHSFLAVGDPVPHESGSGHHAPPAIGRRATPDPPGTLQGFETGRNSNFYHLSYEQKVLIGGREYDAAGMVLKLAAAFHVFMHAFAAASLAIWIKWAAAQKYREYLDSLGINHWWWALFTAQSGVSRLGFTLTPDSMISFQDAPAPMLILTFVALGNNTFFPILFRLLVWSCWRWCKRRGSGRQVPLRFLLDHPRRCFTHLFHRRTTVMLFFILVALNTFDVGVIIVGDLHNEELTKLAVGKRIVAAVFQAANSRYTGMACFNLGKVGPVVQFSLYIMMYIATYPITMSVRSSNVYEERSLGINRPQKEPEDSNTALKYLKRHIRNQLSFDMWYLFAGAFLIACFEGGKIMADPAGFGIFPINFEVMSAYGNVGLSLGYGDTSTSFSAQLGVAGKLVVCAMMYRGRQRGLPDMLDKAILLPGRDPVPAQEEREEQEGEHGAEGALKEE